MVLVQALPQVSRTTDPLNEPELGRIPRTARPCLARRAHPSTAWHSLDANVYSCVPRQARFDRGALRSSIYISPWYMLAKG